MLPPDDSKMKKLSTQCYLIVTLVILKIKEQAPA